MSDKNIFVELTENETNTLSKDFDDLTKSYNDITMMYNLVNKVLAEQKTNNKKESLIKFDNIINGEFVNFANSKSLLAMQSIQNKLHSISNSANIYDKNVVTVAGGFSAGKSEFLSSFFANKEIKLPIGIKPVTAIPTYIIHTNKSTIKGYSNKINSIDIPSELYSKLSHDFIEKFDFSLKNIIEYIVVETELQAYQDICLVDTPGYNPTNTETTESDYNIASEYLQKSDILIWVIGLDASDGAIPASDLEFLENLPENKKLFIVANKADLKSPDDLEEILYNFEDTLDEYGIEVEGISAYSSVLSKEFSYRNQSVFDFLTEVNNYENTSKEKLKNEIKEELATIFVDMLNNCIYKEYSSFSSSQLMLQEAQNIVSKHKHKNKDKDNISTFPFYWMSTEEKEEEEEKKRKKKKIEKILTEIEKKLEKLDKSFKSAQSLLLEKENSIKQLEQKINSIVEEIFESF